MPREQDPLDEFEYNMEPQSFGEAHPILATIAIIAFIIAGGIPAIAMLSPSFACAIGAVAPHCSEQAPVEPATK